MTCRERRTGDRSGEPEETATTSEVWSVMLRAVGLAVVSVLLFGACGGDEDGASETRAESDQVVIRTSVLVARDRRQHLAT